MPAPRHYRSRVAFDCPMYVLERLFDVSERRAIVVQIALIRDELALELREARFDLALALGPVLAVDQQLRARFVGDGRVQDLRADAHEVAIDLLQLGVHRIDLALGRADPRAQHVELTAGLVCIDERLIELGRTHAAVTRAARTDAERVRRLAELAQAL